ncbi:MAG: Hpt domain-containing protein [Zoogloeaceae bacterium]|nr:Hpt domain-containing protein [Zoogloeaceae bacterium]
MTFTAPQPDLGPLNWVKGEIDLALDRARAAIDEAASANEPGTHLQTAQIHIHQARGALSIVGLDGLAQFAEAVDRLASALAKGEHPASVENLAVLRRGLAATANYLDELGQGAPDQPLRLARLYGELNQARGEQGHPADLFFPDLGISPPRREGQPAAPTPDEEQRALKAWRSRFERGLLKWLRAPQDSQGPTEMREAVAGIDQLATAPGARKLWWTSLAFFDSLVADPAGDLANDRKLCTRLDAQMRRLVSGSPIAIERLMRDLLHHIAIRPPITAHQRQVRELYLLDGLLSPAGGEVPDVPLAPLAKQLRDTLVAARNAWDDFSAGKAIALTQFATAIDSANEQCADLHRPLLAELTGTIRDFTHWLRRDPLALTPPLALELASALLLPDAILGAPAQDAVTRGRVADACQRIRTFMAGGIPADDLGAAGDAAARQVEERHAAANLARELTATLSEVEQGLDTFFRNPERRADLAGLDAPLTQLAGALALLDDPAPRELIQAATVTVGAYRDGSLTPDREGFEILAHRLSALGFFLDAIRRGPARLADFLPAPDVPEALQDEEVAPAVAPVTAPAVVLPPAPTEPKIVSVTPEGADDEDLLSAALPIPAPSAQAQALLATPEDALDAELLAIFVEEAHEVLATITRNLEESLANPANNVALTTIRRGFHTLKGSGRMVGLKDLGEAAWALEQTLNRWLQAEWPPTPELHAVIGQAHQLFAAWIAQLEAGGPAGRDAGGIVAEAERLRNPADPASVRASPIATGGAPSEPDELPLDAQPIDFGDLTPDRAVAIEADPFGTDSSALEALPVADDDEAIGLEPDLDATDLEVQPADIAPAKPEPLDLDLDLEGLDALDLAAAEPEIRAAALIPDQVTSPGESAEAIGESAYVSADLGLDVQMDEANPAPLSTELTPLIPDLPLSLDLDLSIESVEAIGLPPLAEVAAPVSGAAVSDSIRLGDEEIPAALHALYLAEAHQHLTALEHEWARLLAHPGTAPAESAIRAAHTLGGISGTTHVDAAHHLARALEHALERLLDSGATLQPNGIGLLQQASACLQAMVEDVAEQRLPGEAPELIRLLDGLPQDQAAPAPFSPAIECDACENKVSEAPAEPLPPAPAIAHLPPAKLVSVADEDVPHVVDDIDAQLLLILKEEGNELLTQIRSTLRAWQSEPEELSQRGALSRLLHTFKGSARMAGAMQLGEFLHQVENRLEAAQGIPVQALVDEIDNAMDGAEQMLAALGRPVAELAPIAQPIAAAKPAPAEGEGGGAGAAMLKLRADTVDRFVNEAGEIGIARTRVEGELRGLRRSLLDLTENVIRLRNQLREIEIQAEVQMQSRMALAESRHGDFDPLEMDRYTRLQELTRMMAESVGDVTTVQQNLLRNLDSADAAVNSQARLSRELQQSLMQVRMVRFDTLADRLHKVVRQSAKDQGKRASLDLKGGRIEIDRGVLEHMTAPLEHLLRNAVAHGIESPADRSAGGKPEMGEIRLSVSQEGNEIVLDLSDDGAGLNFERILAKARAQGLVGADEYADEKRLTNLIFVPGFSTAGTVSTLSGRGVGMDVVKAETAAVGGRIDVKSRLAEGTHFRIYLPLTLAVTQSLLVRATQRTYAIPSSMVAQVIEMKPEALTRLRHDGAMEWMGDSFSYRYLPRLLGDGQSQPELHRTNWVLLLRAGAQTLALHVDGLRGNQEIVVKNAGPQLARIVGVSGATVLGDGEIVLILNPVALASRRQAEEPEERVQFAAPEPLIAQPTVLIVDDSLTVRKITGRLLEREGYRVITAKDGVDALEKLLDDVPQVILSDIEMPRMDGFDLVRNIRADHRLASVPVIMITSRLAEKHQRYAREIGANHYLGKPYREDELLALIREYIADPVAA